VSLDLSEPLRTALVSNSDIAPLLATHLGEPAIFTRVPPPSEAPFPLIIIPPAADIGNEDAIVARRPVVTRDITIAGENDAAAKYRLVEAVAETVRQLFHRQKFSLSVPGYRVIDVVAKGPIPTSDDTDSVVSRVVSLTIRLQAV
jgi:hypothetical protein